MIGIEEREREVEKQEGDNERCSKAEAKTDYAITPSVAEEATAASAGDNRTCSNRENREDKCSGC